jgi:hypothetical protein
MGVKLKKLGRPRCRCEDNIKMYLKGSGHKDVDDIQLTEHSVLI